MASLGLLPLLPLLLAYPLMASPSTWSGLEQEPLSVLQAVEAALERQTALVDPIAPLPLTARVPGARQRKPPRTRKPAQEADDADPYRLRGVVHPLSYEITITPHLELFAFDGSVKIGVYCTDVTSIIVLNVKDLHITKNDVEIFDEQGNEHGSILAVREDRLTEQLSIVLARPMIVSGRYMLHIKYSGNIRNDTTGFYRSSYTVVNSTETKWLATTLFQPTYARRAFPCFDEPSFKAEFTVIIRREERHEAISNMPLHNTTKLEDGRFEDRFHTTPPMSTYLVAFVVSDLVKNSNSDRNFTVWTRPEYKLSVGFGQELGQNALRHMEEYTGLKFTLPKIDQVAVPGLGPGGMENWGLITYMERYLVEISGWTTVTVLQAMATMISHEISHQWFGNLVTMDWWSNTWLNEGFAAFFEYYIANLIKPDWKLMEQSITNQLHQAFDSDVIEDQHAMSSPVSTPDEISGKFDSISYAKGGCILRMFEYIVTPDVFRKALKIYLNKHAEDNASPSDLFEAIEDARISAVLPTSFHEIGASWTEQPGVPVINVLRDDAGRRLTFWQERFFYEEPENKELLKVGWWVPLEWVSKSNPHTSKERSGWLQRNVTQKTFSTDIDGTDWLLVNPSQTGYYRVNYDLGNWLKLAQKVAESPKDFSAASRARLVNDALSLSRAGKLQYHVALRMMSFLAREVELGPWQSALAAVSFLDERLVTTDVYPVFQAWMAGRVTLAYSSVGGFTFESDDKHVRRHMRYLLASWACHFGHEPCMTEAARVLRAWIDNPAHKPHPDVLVPALCYGVRASDKNTFDAVKALWLNEKDPIERYSLLAALGCSSDTSLLQGLLSSIISPESGAPNKEDTLNVISAVSARHENLPFLLKFLREHKSKVDAVFGDSTSAVTLLALMIQEVRTRKQFDEVAEWLATSGKPEALLSALRVADANLKRWYDRYYDQVSHYLNDAASTTPPPSPPTAGVTTPSGLPNNTRTDGVGLCVANFSLLCASLLTWCLWG